VGAPQVDTDKVSQTTPFLHITWSGLVQIFGNLGILIYYIGWPALVGFGVLLVTVPTQVGCQAAWPSLSMWTKSGRLCACLFSMSSKMEGEVLIGDLPLFVAIKFS
jgi:hypothetical protein